MELDAVDVLRSAPSLYDAEPPPQSPNLKPLPPPRGSPAHFQKEPKEFYAQYERELEREVRKNKRLADRGALKEQGYAVALQRPYVPSTIDSDPPARFEPPPLKSVWGSPPFRLAPKPSALPTKGVRAKKAVEGALAAPRLEDKCATIGGEKSRISKEMFRMLEGWSRGHTGTPWTLKQVCAEVEADVNHKKAPDTRAKRGKMGRNEIGMDATVRRREIITFERNFDRRERYSSAASDDPASSNDKGSTMRSSTSLPALTQSSS